MKIQTTRFGELTVEDSRVITFTEAIFGFPESTRYILIDHDPGSPFQWLQSLDQPQTAFVVIDPRMVDSSYRAEVSAGDIADLQVCAAEEAVLLCIVTITSGCASVTANLAGPIILNPGRRLAKQVVLAGTPYGVRHSLLGGIGQTGSGVTRKTGTAASE